MTDRELVASARNPVDLLAEKTGGEWQNLAKARKFTQQFRLDLREKFSGLDTEDASIVVFGSLARDEATSKSDVDWTLLIDGIADPQHLNVAHETTGRLEKFRLNRRDAKELSAVWRLAMKSFTGSAAKATRMLIQPDRILSLLESKPIGRTEAWDRVLNNVLSRYLTEDRGLWEKTKERGVPLFLLNDIARFWRIMVVDFAYKQRDRANQGYALRSIKLGLSRKLIYASGLLACFSCHLDFPEEHWGTLSATGNPTVAYRAPSGYFREERLWRHFRVS